MLATENRMRSRVKRILAIALPVVGRQIRTIRVHGPILVALLGLVVSGFSQTTVSTGDPKDRDRRNLFRKARNKAGLPKELVLYCARHDYGTRVLKRTGNLAAVMRTMGHRDVKTAMHYQHPELEIVRAALDYRPPNSEVA